MVKKADKNFGIVAEVDRIGDYNYIRTVQKMPEHTLAKIEKLGETAQLPTIPQGALRPSGKNLPLQTSITSIAQESSIAQELADFLDGKIPDTMNIPRQNIIQKTIPVGKKTTIQEQMQIRQGVSEPVVLSKSPIPSQETIEKAAQIQMRQKAANNQLPQGTATLPDIIQRDVIDVKSKVNILDYIRTPDRVMKKIGLEKEASLLRTKYNDYLEELPLQINRITQWSREVPPDEFYNPVYSR